MKTTLVCITAALSFLCADVSLGQTPGTGAIKSTTSKPNSPVTVTGAVMTSSENGKLIRVEIIDSIANKKYDLPINDSTTERVLELKAEVVTVSGIVAVEKGKTNLYVTTSQKASDADKKRQLDAFEAKLAADLRAKEPSVEMTLGDDKRMDAKGPSKDPQEITFAGIVSKMKQNGQITEARIGNMDDNMKTSYGIVLDAKGKQLAQLGGAVNVKGRTVVKNGKNMLVVEQFTKFTNTK